MNGSEAHAEEGRIISEYSKLRYSGISLMRYTKTKDMFSVDVLGLDTKTA